MSVARGIAGVAAFAVLGAGSLIGLPGPAQAQELTLRLHNFNSPKAIANRLFMRPWAKEIEEEVGRQGEGPGLPGDAARRQAVRSLRPGAGRGRRHRLDACPAIPPAVFR